MKRRRDVTSDVWCLRDTNGGYPDVTLPADLLDEDGLTDLEAKCVELAVTAQLLQTSQAMSIDTRVSRTEKCERLLRAGGSVLPLGRHTQLPAGQRLLHHAISRVQCVIVRASKIPTKAVKGKSSTPRPSPFMIIALGASPTYVNGERVVSVEDAVVGELLGDEVEEVPSSVLALSEGDIITFLESGASLPDTMEGALSPLSPLRSQLDTLSAAHHKKPLPRFELHRANGRALDERSPSPMTTPHRSLL